MINFFFRLKNRKVNKNAFTIAEMLISIAIIGILASISVPNMLKWVEKERQNAYLRELISYLELVKKETRRWNGRCTLQTNTRLRNSIDPVTSKHIGFKAFNVNCYDMNDSEIKNIQSRVPLIEHKVFQEVNMQTFNFTPRGNLSIPTNQNDLVIIIGGRPDANYYQKGKCIVVSAPMGLINAGNTRSEVRFYSGRYANRQNSALTKQSCDLL